MNSRTFSSFVKEAISPDFVVGKAGPVMKKLMGSAEGQARLGRVRERMWALAEKSPGHHGFDRVSPTQMAHGVEGVMRNGSPDWPGVGGWKKHIDHPFGQTKKASEYPADYFSVRQAVMQKLAFAFPEAAGHAAEIAGLGILARPTIQKMRGKEVSERSEHLHELGGLGVLAVPSAVNLAGHYAQKFRKPLATAGHLLGH